MPVIIPKNIPAHEELLAENVFVMNHFRAIHQDIRALEILVLNLMPTKKDTELQLMRLLSNTPLHINVTLLTTDSYQATHTSKNHLDTFYKTFSQVKNLKYDGMIITGAPVEKMPFEEVIYWNELKEIMDYSQKNVTSVLHICWGAQAGLYHHYGIKKKPLKEKLFGIFDHTIHQPNNTLLKGFDDQFCAPHSRYTENSLEDLLRSEAIEVLASSEKAGFLLAISKDNKNIFCSGHLEYSKDTLHKEYMRDLNKGIPIDVPNNYYKNDDYKQPIDSKWRSHAFLLFMNWLNYNVYQKTPYDLYKGDE
jgi:homoserine O-succinyltransferase